MSDSYLQSLVINKCKELGAEKSAEFFEVSVGLVRQWINGSKTPSLASVEKVFSVPEGQKLTDPANARISINAHENLVRFATEAYLKLQDQHELIQHLRHLVATTPEKPNARKTD